jgi:hypothetical protein
MFLEKLKLEFELAINFNFENKLRLARSRFYAVLRCNRRLIEVAMPK